MPTTTNYGWVTPALGDEPNGPEQMQDLAVGIDGTLKGLADGFAADITALEAVAPFGARHNSAVQSIPNITTTTVTSMDVSDGLKGGMAWSSNRFTVPTAGVYDITARVSWASNATGGRLFYVRKNGVVIATFNSAAQGNTFTASGSVHADLAAADYIDLAVYQSSGGALNIIHNAGDVGLTIVRVGN